MGINFEVQRQSMVEMQIKNRGVNDDKVIEAMLKVPREIFVPEGEKDNSYFDGPLAIGFGQTISQPFIVAYMTELLEIEGIEKVLEIGTGSGYQTAVLAEIVQEVYTIEIVEELGKKAKNILQDQLYYSNIHFRIGNGREGWPEFSPYDRIILTAAPSDFPRSLFSQLNENGIAIAPVGDFFQTIMQYRRVKNKINEKSLIGVSFVPLI
jgi:protein-L-isoaspartate(D-aspartate) O-methyltransferase